MTGMRIALVAAAMLTLAGCGGGGSGDGASSTAPREAAPAITGTTLEGRDLSLEQFRGQPVMVNAWASW